MDIHKSLLNAIVEYYWIIERCMHVIFEMPTVDEGGAKYTENHSDVVATEQLADQKIRSQNILNTYMRPCDILGSSVIRLRGI